MRTTLLLDDDLLAKARAYSGLVETTAIVSEALTALVERESGRRLARLGGSEPDLEAPRRRRAKPARWSSIRRSIDDFRGGDTALARALERGAVLTHLFVVGDKRLGRGA